MAANLTDHSEITAFQTVSGNTDLTGADKEKSGQTFLRGVPVMFGATSFVIEWDGTSGLGGTGIGPNVGILGISLQPGANLATDGAGAPGSGGAAFTGVGFPGSSLTYGKVPYESAAVNIPPGAPFSDGRTFYSVATEDTFFLAQVDNSAFAVAADATPVQGDIGKEFGLTKDTTGHWYVDRGKTTVGTNTCVVVKGIDPRTGSILNGQVWFMFKSVVLQEGH